MSLKDELCSPYIKTGVYNFHPGCESLSIKVPGLLGPQRKVYKRPDHTHGLPNWRLSSSGLANRQGKLRCKGEWAPRRQLQPASLVLIPWVKARAAGLQPGWRRCGLFQRVHTESLQSYPHSATPWTASRQVPLSVGILQARVLAWAAVPSSRGSSWPDLCL